LDTTPTLCVVMGDEKKKKISGAQNTVLGIAYRVRGWWVTGPKKTPS